MRQDCLNRCNKDHISSFPAKFFPTFEKNHYFYLVNLILVSKHNAFLGITKSPSNSIFLLK